MLAFYLLPLCTFTSSVAGQGSDAATNWCPPLGPALPPPRSLRMDSSFEKLMDSVGAVTNNLVQQLGLNNTAVSLAAQSIHDAAPFFSHQITPQEMNPKGVRGVTEDTIFRIGSVSKVFTVLAILKAGVALSDPVTHYLPELFRLQGQSSKDPLDSVATVDWTSVTIDALTSQLAGISGQFGEDIANSASDVVGYGLPPVPSGEHTECGGNATDRACNRADFFAKFAQRRPVYAPYTTPVYSNEAYALLGWVTESATNMTYGDYLQENVFEPLGMAHSSLSKPDDSHGFLAVDEDYWPTARGLENPSGGIYASTGDLLRFGAGILSSKLLSPLQTRHWLKPKTHTSSLGLSVGAPWEIARSDAVTSDKRVVDFYTKTGGLGIYNAILVLVPDYDIVLTAFLAGPEVNFGLGTMLGVASKLVETLVPAVEAVGKRESRARYAGIYGDPGSNDTMTIIVDSGPGLHVTRWLSEGRDILRTYEKITSSSAAGAGNGPLYSLRLYPTSLDNFREEAWRAVYTPTTPKQTAVADSQLFFEQGSCQTWSAIDENLYGLVGLDDFRFEVDKGSSHATAVCPRAFRQTLQHQGRA